MRSVLVFPTSGREVTAALLDRHLPGQCSPWSDGTLYVEIDDVRDGCLYVGWDLDDVRSLENAVGYLPAWAVQIDVSGRVDGTVEVRRMVELLLERGGVAMDDYSSHAWTAAEIRAGAIRGGLGFFDFRGYRERTSRPDPDPT